VGREREKKRDSDFHPVHQTAYETEGVERGVLKKYDVRCIALKTQLFLEYIKHIL